MSHDYDDKIHTKSNNSLEKVKTATLSAGSRGLNKGSSIIEECFDNEQFIKTKHIYESKQCLTGRSNNE